MNTKELALSLIDAGYSVIPCYGRSHNKAKAPLVPHGQYDASRDPEIVGKWFQGAADKLIGIPCKANGFFAVDVDGPEGADTWQEWTTKNGLPEPGPLQCTKHGYHYIFKYPDFDFPGSVKKLGAGLDLRANNYICTGGDGGDGTGYEWLVPLPEPGDIPEAPQWLLNKIKAAIPRLNLPELDAPAAAPIDNPDAVIGYWLDKFAAQATIGSRNEAAYRLGLQLHWSGIPVERALDAGQDFIHVIPQGKDHFFSLKEYTSTIRSAYKVPMREAATLPRAVTEPEVKAAAEVPPEPQKQPKIEGKAKTAIMPKIENQREASESIFSTWADLDAVLGPIEWDWPGWLAKGFLHILVGMTGEGKSRLALRLCGTYLTGLEWPDGTPYQGAPACVLWGEAEAGQAMNRDRAKFMDLPTDKIYSPLGDPLGDFRLNDPNHLAKLAYMAELPEVKLIVIDSLSGADPTAEKSTEDAKNVNWLAGLARDVQKPIILTHHLRKRGLFDTEGEVSLDRVRGISTILQYARVIWAIDTPNLEDKETKRLSVIKSNLAKKPEPIGFTINDHIEFTEAPRKPKTETIKDKAVDLMLAILARGPISAAQAEKDFTGAGLSRRAMFDAKKALAVVSVKRGDNWLWSLPAVGDLGGDIMSPPKLR